MCQDKDVDMSVLPWLHPLRFALCANKSYPHVVQLLLQLRRLGCGLYVCRLSGIRTPLLLARRRLRRCQGALLRLWCHSTSFVCGVSDQDSVQEAGMVQHD